MRLVVIGCSFRTTPVALRERLAFDDAKLALALDELGARYGCEAVILSTCNRVELYLGHEATQPPLDAELIAEFLSEIHRIPSKEVRPHLYERLQQDAVRHLFRVAASLDSQIVGEGQIAGQVKQAYETAMARSSAGPLLHALFQKARLVAKRARRETGIAKGHVSVSSVAVEYVRQVFDHFHDKTILVIGAGKMGELTLRHLRHLQPLRILVTNRSPEKAAAVAQGCAGMPVPWEGLDDALAQADIVLSTTGAPEPIMSRSRFNKLLGRRAGGPMVILDIAVPRDFEPDIHDGDRTCLFNIDDLTRIRQQVLHERQQHIAPAEAIVEQEAAKFLKDWTRRRHGPVIARLNSDLEAKREAIVRHLFSHLNGQLSEADRKHIEGAFRLLQNQFLHGPISALTEETHADTPVGSHTLLEALRKLFRLQE
ncbi:MAG: glutamyl-tRNA reductase [Gemmataceae bacterium]